MISAPMKMASFYTPVSNSQCQAGIHPWSMKFGAPEMFKTLEMRKRMKKVTNHGSSSHLHESNARKI